MKIYTINLFAFVLMFIFAGVSQNVHAQKIDKTRDGYIMDHTLYLKKDMKDLFKDSPDAMKYYNKANNKKAVGNVTLGLGIASTIPGILLIRSGRKIATSNTNNLGEAFVNGIAGGISITGGLVLVGVGVGLGTISFISYSSSRSNYKRALREYNWSEIEKNGYKKDETFIQTSLSGNGLSLTYNF